MSKIYSDRLGTNVMNLIHAKRTHPWYLHVKHYLKKMTDKTILLQIFMEKCTSFLLNSCAKLLLSESSYYNFDAFYTAEEEND